MVVVSHSGQQVFDHWDLICSKPITDTSPAEFSELATRLRVFLESGHWDAGESALFTEKGVTAKLAELYRDSPSVQADGIAEVLSCVMSSMSQRVILLEAGFMDIVAERMYACDTDTNSAAEVVRAACLVSEMSRWPLDDPFSGFPCEVGSKFLPFLANFIQSHSVAHPSSSALEAQSTHSRAALFPTNTTNGSSSESESCVFAADDLEALASLDLGSPSCPSGSDMPLGPLQPRATDAAALTPLQQRMFICAAFALTCDALHVHLASSPEAITSTAAIQVQSACHTATLDGLLRLLCSPDPVPTWCRTGAAAVLRVQAEAACSSLAKIRQTLEARAAAAKTLAAAQAKAEAKRLKKANKAAAAANADGSEALAPAAKGKGKGKGKGKKSPEEVEAERVAAETAAAEATAAAAALDAAVVSAAACLEHRRSALSQWFLSAAKEKWRAEAWESVCTRGGEIRPALLSAWIRVLVVDRTVSQPGSLNDSGASLGEVAPFPFVSCGIATSASLSGLSSLIPEQLGHSSPLTRTMSFIIASALKAEPAAAAQAVISADALRFCGKFFGEPDTSQGQGIFQELLQAAEFFSLVVARMGRLSVRGGHEYLFRSGCYELALERVGLLALMLSQRGAEAAVESESEEREAGPSPALAALSAHTQVMLMRVTKSLRYLAAAAEGLRREKAVRHAAEDASSPAAALVGGPGVLGQIDAQQQACAAALCRNSLSLACLSTLVAADSLRTDERMLAEGEQQGVAAAVSELLAVVREICPVAEFTAILDSGAPYAVWLQAYSSKRMM